MEDMNPQDTTTEYVIQLHDGGIIQSQDLEQIVNLAIVSSNTDQVYTVHDVGTIAAVVDVGTCTTEHGEDSLQTDLVETQQQDQERKVPSSSGGNNIESVVEDKRQNKAAKRRELNLLNKKLAAIPKKATTFGPRKEVEIQVQPFTIETLKNCFAESRLYNKTRTIFDYLMYDKFPEGYTNNQKQALRDVRDNYIIVDKKLYYRQKKDKNVHLLLVIHDEQADMQLEILHDGHMTKSGSHQGINRTISQIKKYFYWHGLTEHVRMFVKSCKMCCLKQTLTKEREKFLQLNMQNSNFSNTLEGMKMSERVDLFSNEFRRLQNSLKPFETQVWLQKLKTEVNELNTSISQHRDQNQTLADEFSSVVADKVNREVNDIVVGSSAAMAHERTLTENVERNYSAEACAEATVAGDENYDLDTGESNTGGKQVSASKEEELKMLETMLPRNRIHNHSRLIEEIIKTNKYPDFLTPGQIIGLSQVKTHYIMVNDDLYRVFSKKGKMQNVAKVIHDDEPSLKRKIMKACHVEENGKHLGMNRTISHVNEAFYWQSMSMHIRIFLEYCPVCRNRRGSVKTTNNYVAETNNISDICLKISNSAKDTFQEVQDNLDLTSEDYGEVKKLAEEVKELNSWLAKNPTIKNEWEYMFQKCSRGQKTSDYDRHLDKETSTDHETLKEFVAVALGNTGNITVEKPDLAEDTAIVKEKLVEMETVSSKCDQKEADKEEEGQMSIEGVTESVGKTRETNNEKSVSEIVETLPGLTSVTEDISKVDELPWSVNLEDSADESVEETVNDWSDNQTYTENTDNYESDSKNITEHYRDHGISLGDAKNLDKVNDKNSTADNKMVNEDLNNLEMEDLGPVNKRKKRKYLANLKLAETADSSERVDEKDLLKDGKSESTEDRSPDVLAMGKTTGSRRQSRRLQSKVAFRQSEFEMQTMKENKSNKPKTEQKEKMSNEKITAETVTPTRRSVRKRTLTPKFSGYVKSKNLQALSSASDSDAKEKLDETKNHTVIEDTNSPTKTEAEENRKEEAESTLVKQSNIQLKRTMLSIDTGSATTEAESVLRSHITGHCVQSTSMKDRDNVPKDTLTHIQEEGAFVPFSGAKSRGILMKNSDVHIVKRKSKGNGSAKNDYCKKKRVTVEGNSSHILDSSRERNVSETSEQSPTNKGNDTDTKAIIIPRYRKGVMTKNNISIIKQSNEANVSDKVGSDKYENKEASRSLCYENLGRFEKQQGLAKEGSNTSTSLKMQKMKMHEDVLGQADGVQENKALMKNALENRIGIAGLKKKEKEMKDSVLDEGSERTKTSIFQDEVNTYIERTSCDLPTFRENEIKTSKPQELHMKYNINFRKNKVESQSAFRKQYNSFVALNRESDSFDGDNPAFRRAQNEMQGEIVEVSMDVSDDTESLTCESKGEHGTCKTSETNKNKNNDTSDNRNTKFNLECSVNENHGYVGVSNTHDQKYDDSKDESPVIIIKLKTKQHGFKESDVGRQISDETTSDFEIVCQKKTSRRVESFEAGTFYVKSSTGSLEKEVALRSEENSGQTDHQTVGRTFDCPLCLKSFENEKSYFLHKGVLCNLVCSFCSLEFNVKYKNNFLKHENKHKTDVNHPCPECDRLFFNESLLDIHRRIHADAGVINCSECNETFYSYFNLAIHCEDEHPFPLVYICDVCSAHYGSRKFLSERQFADGGLKFYLCAMCESKI